ncbi:MULTISPECIES: ABC transporter permease [Bifidobacterium]|uniref:ABC transporter permease n=1 Tax=Bifidobacterium TaxID=1678 RepID=UPI001BDD4962|nr:MULTISPECIES: ABC transporter permease [Bifidobacterium]MBT1161289.1 ABC transporter permease [Bifidobacterium sp. SO1]MBW3078337.1 ABC transporter permease [Bifidobacterium simiiventris]
MGRHQRAETLGLVSFLICAIVAFFGMKLYLDLAPAIWQVTQRRFSVAAAIIAACGVISFVIGYASNSRSFTLKHGWWVPIRRIFEILALSVVYAATIFLSSFALFSVVNTVMGMHLLAGYMPAACAGFAGVAGYMTFVQAELMNAKTLASLLPFFVISGVSTAGLTTDDPYWYHNNFSQLGDRTTFAATMFNATLILAGTCIIIVSYFAVSELITTQRLERLWHEQYGDEVDHPEIKHFKVRIAILSLLLTVSGLAFVGIGVFRYTPHYIMHNVCAKGLPLIMGVLLLALPWLAPRMPKAMYAISDLAIAICAGFGIYMLRGYDTLTNLEALACAFFLGWFIVFSRQIAAIEADRVQMQLVRVQADRLDIAASAAANGVADAQAVAHATNTKQPAEKIESRLAADR